MITAFRLAGFFAAHAIWCVSDGENLIPMLGFVTESDEREMERLIVNDDLKASVNFGNQKLEANEMNATDAVFLYDGLMPLGGEKIDAVVIKIRSYFSPESKATLAIPYTPQVSGEFRVHKPKLLEWENCEDFDLSAAFETFFEGVTEHEPGAEVWNNHLDESK